MEIIFFILLSFAIEAVCLCRIFALTFGGRESCGLERLAKGFPRPQQIALACVLVAAVIYGGSKPGAPVGAPTSPSATHGKQGNPNAYSNANTSADEDVGAPSASLVPSPQSLFPNLDSDGDGIPDIYERWTHSDPQVADSHFDRDNDGLTDLEEYHYKTDPRRPDTDNDGLSDWHETLNPLALEYALNPVAKETFIADEPDENANNIPDIWDESPHNFGFTDANNDGFDDNYARQYLPDASGENFDIIATVSSSRTACLTWGTGAGASASAGEGMILPPCTNLAVRLRLDATRAGTVRLIAAPDGVELAGLWKASLKLSLDERRGHEIERNRARFGGGKIIEHEEGTGRFIGFLGSAVPQAPAPASAPAPAQQQQQFNTNSGNVLIGGIGGGAMHLSSGGSGGSGGVSKSYYSPSIEIGALYPRCRIHGPGLAVTAIVENVSMPLSWKEGNKVFVEGDALFFPEEAYDGVIVTCRGNGNYERINVEDTEIFSMGICETNTLAIKGAAWGSTHSHTDASDHLPDFTETIVTQFATNCPPATNTVVTIGFRHDLSFLKTRNLVYIGRDELDETDHCIGVLWRQGGKINLWNLLDSNYLPYKERLALTTNNGSITLDGELEHGKRLKDLAPRICHIQVVDKETDNKMLDQLWIVINSQDTNDEYSKWRTRNASLAWTAHLPKPFASITNVAGTVTDPEPGAPNDWSAPASNGSLLHHNAAYTMRSRAVGPNEQHGHQAAYDAEGVLIRSTIAAGTADLFAPTGVASTSNHREEDVHPFLRALQLDGNPVLPSNGLGLLTETVPTNLSRPCLYQGGNTDTYISLRPITPTGVE